MAGKKNMKFYARDRQIPDRLLVRSFQIRPLLAEHVDLDYDAVMEDPAYLRQWGQGHWPADDFTRAENLVDLRKHEREHKQGSAFTFTVLAPEGDRCLGCVYITPFGMRIAPEWIPPAHRPDPQSFTADICFWVRPSLHADNLDVVLARSLVSWLVDDWYFDHLFFHTSDLDQRQQRIFDASGLEEIARFQAERPRPGKWRLYELP